MSLVHNAISAPTSAEQDSALDRILRRAKHLLGTRVMPITIMITLKVALFTKMIDLDRMESFDDANFMHDIVGLLNHMNRDTGLLEDCFLPRCAPSAQ